ncbi:MAG: S46 family peptidase [Alistipes sp.]|nr:S46 family peptidase [Alistipes sp.]
MIRKTLLISLLTFAVGFTAFADKGMWLPSLISSRMKDMRSKGFRLTAEDIYSINKASLKDAVVLFDGGCTGEIVSAEGLLLTNHHCGYGAIQSLSSVEHDYLTNGFWAMSRNEELPCKGLTVEMLVRMEEITDRLAAGEKAEEIIAAAEAEGKGYSASVEQMYYGNQQFLFVYKVFSDVRLVGTPPSSIGKFGGDTDNWIWPRHTGDFSVFRIYSSPDNEPAAYSSGNVPYRPARHFEISTAGVKEGDFTMIYGFPGNTQEYITSDAVDYIANVADPVCIALRTERLDIIRAAQERDPKVRIQYAAKHASIANAWKKWQGEVLGIKRLGTVDKKRAYEQRFVAENPDKAYLLDSLHAAYLRNTMPYHTRTLFIETLRAIELPQIVRFAMLTPDRERAALVAQNFYKNYDASIDRAIAQRMVAEFLRLAPEGGIPESLSQLVARYGGAEAYVDYLYDNSRFVSIEGFSTDAAADDAVAELVEAMTPLYELSVQYAYRNLSNVPDIERWYRPYVKALMEWDRDRAFFPDANLTLRVAYGKIAGYDYADGVYHRPQTTLEGIIEKDNPEIYDYDIPQSLRDIYACKQYGRWGVEIDGRRSVPVCFIATNHTTGGNSGSPVIDARGRLIGINFDRTWLSTMSDVEFDEEICRNIAVDIRYVLFTIDRVGGAGYLLDEMTLR